LTDFAETTFSGEKPEEPGRFMEKKAAETAAG